MQTLAGFDERTGATGTDVHTLSLALIGHRSLLYVGFPLPIGGPFGVAHIVTKLRSLAADLTFRHFSTFQELPVITVGAMIPRTDKSCNRKTKYSTVVLGTRRALCQED